MTTKTYQLLLVVPVLVGCRQPLPCTDCGADDKANDDVDEPDPDLPPPSDLPPCGDVAMWTCSPITRTAASVDMSAMFKRPVGRRARRGSSVTTEPARTASVGLSGALAGILEQVGGTCTTGCAAMGEDNLAAVMMVFVDELFPANCLYAASLGLPDETYPLDVGCDDPLPWQPFSMVWCCAEQLPPP
jgi:hypothetical protein